MQAFLEDFDLNSQGLKTFFYNDNSTDFYKVMMEKRRCIVLLDLVIWKLFDF